MKNQALLLVAEDDPDDQYFFQEAVAVACPKEVETHYAFDGAQLLKLLREKRRENYRRNLVVLDLNMHVRDGRATLLELKAEPDFADIPVVILTTSDNQDDLEYCRQHGATAYFRKPSTIVELVNIIRDLCNDYLD